VWHANKAVAGDPFGPPAERLPNKPHGLNRYSAFDDVVFLSSLNPAPDHFRLLDSRGLSGGRVRAFTYYSQAYQAVLRTSLRDPNNRTPKRILVPDHDLAKYLHDVFPGSRLEKLDIGLKDEPIKKNEAAPGNINQARTGWPSNVSRPRNEKPNFWPNKSG
jgi:hypothetical protein